MTNLSTPQKKERAKRTPKKRSTKKLQTATPARPPVQKFEPETHWLPQTALEAKRERAIDDVAGLSIQQLTELYRFLFETRRLEEHLVALYRQTKVVGGVYRSLGQEATAVGCSYALSQNDIVQPLIRDLGAALVHGVTPIAILRQYMAKSTGPTGGRDLNTHFSAPQHGLLGPVSMLGAMVPVLAGTLLAARLRHQPKAGLCFIGDGGSSTGAFYEGFNFAAVQKLPLIAVIQNNRYAYSTPTAAQVPEGDLIRRAKGFGAPVYHVDGNDVLACYQATQEARAAGLQGLGPSLIIADTYRRKGHAEHDNQAYIPDNEPEQWEQHNDPVRRYEELLTGGQHIDERTLHDVRATVESELNTAREQAVDEPFPDPSTQQSAVFADDTQPWPDVETWFQPRAHYRAQ